jgi:hypothetical protein
VLEVETRGGGGHARATRASMRARVPSVRRTTNETATAPRVGSTVTVERHTTKTAAPRIARP